jgi:hypothetical protein
MSEHVNAIDASINFGRDRWAAFGEVSHASDDVDRPLPNKIPIFDSVYIILNCVEIVNNWELYVSMVPPICCI